MRLGLVLLCGGLLYAQSQPAAQDKCRLEGQVLNSVTGQGVRKVRVTLMKMQRSAPGARQPAPMSAGTDTQGRFVFGSLDAGSYMITVQRDGFQYTPTPARRQETVVLAPGDQKTDVVLRLAPLGVVAGRIRDEDGDPLRRVQVNLMMFQYTPYGRQLSARDGGDTNDLGEYRIFNVPPGKYYLKATPMGMTPTQAGAGDNETLAAAYFPGSPDPSSASQIEVQPGEELGGMDLTLRRVHGVAVSGRVTGLPATGASGVRAFVSAGPASVEGIMGSSAGVTADAQGNFEIRPLAPGSYFLTAQAMAGDVRYSGRLPVQVGSSDIEGLQLQLAPPVDVNGVVRVEGDVNARLSQTRVSLQVQGFGYNGAGGSQMAKDDGSFTFKNVQPGPYKVMFNAPPVSSSAGPGSPSLYLKSVRCGDAEVGDTGVDFSNGAACDLSITFSANGGQIQGKVERDSSENGPPLLVTLIPTGTRRDPSFFKRSGVDDNGGFRFTGVAPGAYKLFAWESGSEDTNTVLYDPDFLTPYESQGQDIQISENAQETATLKVVKIPEAK